MKCSICGGRRELVSYDTRQSLSPVLDKAPNYRVQVKRYPCPACHKLVEPTHAAVVSTVFMHEDANVPAVIDEAKKQMAHELGEQLLERGLIDFAYTQMWDGAYFQHARTLRATVYVVSPDNTPDETSIAADRKKAVQEEKERVLRALQDGVHSGKLTVYPFGDVAEAILGESENNL